MKLIKNLVLFLLIAIIFLVVFRNPILKAAIPLGASVAAGIDVKLESINVGLFDSKLHIKGLKVQNPKDFQEPILLDLPEFLVDYHLRNILAGKIHLEKFILNLESFNLVKNEKGVSNLEAIAPAKKEGTAQDKPKEKPVEKPKKDSKPLDLQIDYLKLRIGKLSVQDFSKDPNKPKVNTYNFNIEKEYNNLTDPKVLVASLISVFLTKAPISLLKEFGLDDLLGPLSGALDLAGGIASGALDVGKLVGSNAKGIGLDSLNKMNEAASVDGLKNLGANALGGTTDLASGLGNTAAESTKQVADTATEAIKGTTDALKGVASGLGGLLKKDK